MVCKSLLCATLHSSFIKTGHTYLSRQYAGCNHVHQPLIWLGSASIAAELLPAILLARPWPHSVHYCMNTSLIHLQDSTPLMPFPAARDPYHTWYNVQPDFESLVKCV